MIARFRDFICKIQVKTETKPPFFRQSNFIPPRFPILERLD